VLLSFLTAKKRTSVFYKLEERKMRKTMFMMAVLTVGMIGVVQAQPDMTVPLIAGQDMEVGRVEVTLDGDLYVRFVLDAACDDVLITETHLHIGEDLGDFPLTKKSGAPKIGQFDYSMDHDPAVIEYTYQIPAGELPEDPFLIAAHAVTGTDYCSADELPEVVTGEVCWPLGDPTKYFELTISGDGVLDGLHDAWCADPALSIGFVELCTGDIDWAVVPSVPSEINCLLNLINRGETTAFDTGDLQLAIWILLEGLEDLEALEAAHPGKTQQMIDNYLSDELTVEENVAAILQMVSDECDGFSPGCCDVMGVLLVPIEPLQVDPVILRQPILIAIPAPCCETAWGDGETGLRFSTSTWATYFWFPSAPI
jgi:hypothetical protein